ncbi:TSUP family transporter [Hymenobacter sp. 5317J-9]|uniref:TSUP family transporter n=1 Tax=Hymenobacter sp. 5317J-9 TaxID=2932250 RepID=UPI001FD6FBF4|nr:TSUP family transporter [Hymenobacter sp. 5317J-9]UOQ98334.1 TSUP family transporter [Hymenobacter sp. 5317J-9]
MLSQNLIDMWWIYALLSAVFAALTAVLAKIGIRGVDSNLATALRTVVIYRHLNVAKKVELGNPGMVLGGALTGFLSGLTGSAGPTGALFFLGLNLPPVAYVASAAFASLVLHLTKTIVYSKYALVTTKGLLVGTFTGVAMIGGSYTGKLLLSRISKEKFLMVVEGLIVVFGLQMMFVA